MSFIYAFGDFEAESGSIPPQPYTPQLTCKGIYDYAAEYFDQNIYIAFQHQGKLILIDRSWNIAECFPQITNYQLIIYLNRIQATPNPPYKLMEVTIIFKINENTFHQIIAQPTQTFNAIEIPQGHNIVSIFDCEGTEIIDRGKTLGQYQQPFTIKLVPQTLLIHVYIDNNFAYELQAQYHTLLRDIISQIPSVKNYGLYDNNSQLLVNTDVMLGEFIGLLQPLFLLIQTTDFQQKPPVVGVDIYVNGQKQMYQVFETDKTIQDIINFAQIKPGEIIKEFSICDASQQSLEVDFQTKLEQFFGYTSPLQLLILTSQDQTHQVQSVVCVNKYQSNKNVIGSATLTDILTQLHLPVGLMVDKFYLDDANGRPLSDDPNKTLDDFVACTQPLFFFIKTTPKSFMLNIYLNNQLLDKKKANLTNRLSEIVSQIEIPRNHNIQRYVLQDAQQATIATGDIPFSQLTDKQDPFSLYITIQQNNSKIRIVEVIQTDRLNQQQQNQQQRSQQSVRYQNNQQQPQQQINYLHQANIHQPIYIRKNVQTQDNYKVSQRYLQQPPSSQSPTKNIQSLNKFQNQQQVQQIPNTNLQIQQVLAIQACNLQQKIKFSVESMQILKKLTLLIDDLGEYVIYHYHPPIKINGILLKDKSTSKFNTSKYQWKQLKNIKYSQTGDYDFAIMWDNGNISSMTVNIL